MTKAIITQSELKAQLHYDAETGIFTKILGRKRLNKHGTIGCINYDGYHSISVLGSQYLSHRLAWLYFYGEMPKNQIDHINHNKLDNRICNLREATHSQNQQNTVVARANSKSGLLGVFWCKKHLKYCASIRFNKRLKHLGYFDDKYEAHNAYVVAKRKIHEFNTL